MTLMIAGLVLFLGTHLVPSVPRFRDTLRARVGPGPYRGLFSLLSLAGIVLVVAGYGASGERVALFEPFAAARRAAPLLVTVAIVLFASANIRTHIRYAVRHPMLIGLFLWSGVHLLANGDRAGTVLFASFFVYSIFDLVSAERRGAVKPFVPSWTHDLIATVAGLAVAFLVMRYHAAWFGTSPVV